MRTETLVESRASMLRLTDAEASALTEAGVRLAVQSGQRRADEELDHDDRTVIECVRVPGQEWRVVVRNAIGVVSVCNSLQLLVQPKIPTAHLLYLFEAAGALPRLSGELGHLQGGESFWELVARWFLRAVQQVLRSDLLRDYTATVDELAMVHGAIRPLETAQQHYSGRMTLKCDFDEFGPDIPLNRVLKAAARVVVRNPLIQEETRRAAQRVLQRFDDVGDLQPRDTLTNVDRRSAYYGDAITLAKHILSATGRSLDPGSNRVWTFLIRTPDLVEDGLRRLLVAKFGPKTIGQWPAPIVGSRRTLNPDLVIAEGRAVADVKYKVAADDLNRGDLFQAVAFATGFGCDHAAILGFRVGPAPPYGQLRVGRVDVRSLWWRADSELSPIDAANHFFDDIGAWLELMTPSDRHQPSRVA
jgi:5-methylcytosine-specific restriction enzyme subunit McrC